MNPETTSIFYQSTAADQIRAAFQINLILSLLSGRVTDRYCYRKLDFISSLN
jgi:hypothetical protein